LRLGDEEDAGRVGVAELGVDIETGSVLSLGVGCGPFATNSGGARGHVFFVATLPLGAAANSAALKSAIGCPDFQIFSGFVVTFNTWVLIRSVRWVLTHTTLASQHMKIN
jgi:hypothetical protein